jgi:hypothetical protein
LRRKNAIVVLYLIVAFVATASVPFFQVSSFLRACMLVIFGAAFMFLTIGVITYSMIFPEIPTGKGQKLNSEESLLAYFEGVMKVLREDERKVCMVLWKEGGTALQKDVRWLTGFSKVKTHRAVSRLASRGVITVEKEGKENKLSLASWLKDTTDKGLLDLSKN